MRQDARIEHNEAVSGVASPEPLAALHTECVEAGEMLGLRTAWTNLCARALEPNVFLEPAFALPLIQHVATARPPRFLLAWELDGPASFGRLVGLMPVRLPRRGGGIAKSFTSNLAALGTPLLDRDRSDDAFAAMLAWLGAGEHSLVALVLRDVTLDGSFHATATRCARDGLHILDRRLRAILHRIDQGAAISIQSAKRRKELRRQHRRLNERGVRRYTSARAPNEVAQATERFLALEYRGWKGRRGTALLADAATATFTRTMTRLMAEGGKCRIDAAEIDGKPAGMGIILTSGDRAFFWKTSFDEKLAALSPGMQFTLDLTDAQRADPLVATTDSCAMPDHPMINRVWRDRLAFGDIMIALGKAKSRRFERAVRWERLAIHVRANARSWRRWWRDTSPVEERAP